MQSCTGLELRLWQRERGCRIYLQAAAGLVGHVFATVLAKHTAGSRVVSILRVQTLFGGSLDIETGSRDSSSDRLTERFDQVVSVSVAAAAAAGHKLSRSHHFERTELILDRNETAGRPARSGQVLDPRA